MALVDGVRQVGQLQPRSKPSLSPPWARRNGGAPAVWHKATCPPRNATKSSTDCRDASAAEKIADVRITSQCLPILQRERVHAAPQVSIDFRVSMVRPTFENLIMVFIAPPFGVEAPPGMMDRLTPPVGLFHRRCVRLIRNHPMVLCPGPPLDLLFGNRIETFS